MSLKDSVKKILKNLNPFKRKDAKEIIEKAIEYGGTTIRSYTSSLGVTGKYQDYLEVHTKAGEKCPQCGTIIKKEKVGGRSTYYCPRCQK